MKSAAQYNILHAAAAANKTLILERRGTMIFGNIQNLKEYTWLEKEILECFQYAERHDLKGYEKGSHEIDGKRLFVNIVEYETVEAEKRFWEAHREYLDVHLILDGTEQIDLNFIENMDAKDYVPEDDFLPMEGRENCSAVLHKGDFLICYPSDGHRTAVAAEQPETVKKAIFKVHI